MPGYKRTKITSLARWYSLHNKKDGSTNLKRPHLNALKTRFAVEESMIAIEKEIDQVLRQTACTSYSPAFVDQLNRKLSKLQREHTARKQKLHTFAQSNTDAKLASSDLHEAHSMDNLSQTISSLNHPLALTRLPLLQGMCIPDSPPPQGLVSYDTSGDES
ncbi:unnamed protein product [Dicrocoelium dendriticum]|nr:unnamed protein product [Dicrocoelium dendriticum]